MPEIWAVLPVATLEMDRDTGDLPGDWIRPSLRWQPEAGLLQILGGLGREVGSAHVPTTYEAAVGVRVRALMVYLGGRFGAEPAPGNTYVLGAVFAPSHWRTRRATLTSSLD
jgi:hypothetical protein